MKKLFILTLLLAVTGFAQTAENRNSWASGVFNAAAYNYGISAPAMTVTSGFTGTGSQTMTVSSGVVKLGDGRAIPVFSTNAPITVGSGSTKDTVTPTAVSGCSSASTTCLVTASFTYAHGNGDRVQSGTAGLQEAINDAFAQGGGQVTVDRQWTVGGGTDTLLKAAIPYHLVSIIDSRLGPVQYWNIAQSATTALATPTTLTAVTAAPSATPVGAYGTGTYYFCISYVDLMGNEGTCSATFSQAGVATGSFIFTPPAASTGAVGYTIYISLTSGTYAFAYKVPLTSSICTLTKVETVTAACAVTNATYGQTGATATVTAITVNTARLAPNATTISTTSDYVPNPNARTTYSYQPSNRVALPGVVGASMTFPTAAAAASTVPAVIGTLTLPAGFMNYVGRTIRVCGFATQAANGSTATISNIQLWWDADGSNAAGVPVLVGTNPMTNTLVTAKTDQFQFCYDLKTTVAGASVTAGSIQQNGGNYCNQYTSSSVATVPVCVLAQGPSAVGSLNLAGEARIDIVWLHTTGTDANGLVLQDLTVQVLN